MPNRVILACAVSVLLASTAIAAETRSNGSVFLSGGQEVKQNPSPKPLQLTDAQRAQIRQALADKKTQETFQLTNTKSAKNFQPAVGEKIPPSVPAHDLPAKLVQQLPSLTNYKYVKIKDEVLIVNPMSKKIVDMFSQT